MKTKPLAAIVGVLLALTPLTSAHADRPAPERTTYTPTWHKVHFHMNAYDGAGPGAICHGYSSDAYGHCIGYGESGLSAQSYPFEGKVQWAWEDHARRCRDFDGRDTHHWWREVELRKLEGNGVSYLCGFVDRHWGTYRLTEGAVIVDGIRRSVQATSSVVADREHQRGGPLFVHYVYRGGRGYVMGLRGWLAY